MNLIPLIVRFSIFFIKETRYDYLSGNEKKELIADYVDDAQGYPTVILLINGVDSQFRIRNQTCFPQDQIEEFVKRIEYILIGAYNLEGYLIWQKIKKI